MRRAVLAFLVLAAACGDDGDAAAPTTTTTTEATTSTTAGPPTTAPEVDDLLGGFVPEPLEWDDCGEGTECASLAVPVDWSDPTGPTLDLFVARVPAGDPDRRIGALVTNPGGPGASGAEFVFGGGPFAGTPLADRFDQVAWDPRGVGGSAPLECAEDEVETFLRLDSDPDDATEQAALDEAAAAVGDACAEEFGDLLPHVGTDDAARDLEALRRAMDLPLAYVGFSYGTLIGLRYAELFPDGAASIVLDGVVDPTHTLPDLLRGQTRAFERVLTDALGPELEAFDEVAAAVEEEPIPTDDGRGLGPADLATGTVLAGYDESYWPLLRRGVQEAADGDGTILSSSPTATARSARTRRTRRCRASTRRTRKGRPSGRPSPPSSRRSHRGSAPPSPTRCSRARRGPRPSTPSTGRCGPRGRRRSWSSARPATRPRRSSRPSGSPKGSPTGTFWSSTARATPRTGRAPASTRPSSAT